MIHLYYYTAPSFKIRGRVKIDPYVVLIYIRSKLNITWAYILSHVKVDVLHMSLVAHTAGAYPGFHSMK